MILPFPSIFFYTVLKISTYLQPFNPFRTFLEEKTYA